MPTPPVLFYQDHNKGSLKSLTSINKTNETPCTWIDLALYTIRTDAARLCLSTRFSVWIFVGAGESIGGNY